MENNHINYIEFKAVDITATKRFYHECFGWEFTDYGSDYVAFKHSGIEGGFERTDGEIQQGALVVLYHEDLESALQTVVEAGGLISKEIFSFPGGRRFHFKDPSGNELAVWSDQ